MMVSQIKKIVHEECDTTNMMNNVRKVLVMNNVLKVMTYSVELFALRIAQT